MRFSTVACVVVLALQAFAARASEVEGALVRSLPNGDVELENVGPAFATHLRIVDLGTNANCRVACQVFYCDENLPTDDSEIELKDELVNLALKMYLVNVCDGLSADELAVAYRSGSVSRHLDGFRLWAEESLAELGIDVVGVAMKATGDFRRRVSK